MSKQPYFPNQVYDLKKYGKKEFYLLWTSESDLSYEREMKRRNLNEVQALCP